MFTVEIGKDWYMAACLPMLLAIIMILVLLFVLEIDNFFLCVRTDVSSTYSGMISAKGYGGIDPATGVFQTAYSNMWLNVYS